MRHSLTGLFPVVSIQAQSYDWLQSLWTNMLFAYMLSVSRNAWKVHMLYLFVCVCLFRSGISLKAHRNVVKSPVLSLALRGGDRPFEWGPVAGLQVTDCVSLKGVGGSQFFPHLPYSLHSDDVLPHHRLQSNRANQSQMKNSRWAQRNPLINLLQWQRANTNIIPKATRSSGHYDSTKEL